MVASASQDTEAQNVPGEDVPVLCNLPGNAVPEGAEIGYLTTPDKVRLRYGIWPKTEGAGRGTICLVQGRTEFIEKYFETIGDLQRRGFSVATFDWRGQGGSDRLIANARLGHVDQFTDYLVDLRAFHAGILLPDCPPPYYLVGHSMGGLVALMAAARDRLMFDRLFLSAPMLAIPGVPFSLTGMMRLFNTLCFLGLGTVPVARRADRAPGEEAFPGNPLTSDFRRYMRMVSVYSKMPELEVGAPTMRWSAAAFGAMARAANPLFAQGIKTPVLMLAGARDEVVSTPAIERLGLSLRTGAHLVIGAARHELFMETDEIRGQVMAAFDAFITGASR